jgi:hypothetical protein
MIAGGAAATRYITLDPAFRRSDPLRFDALLAGFQAGYARVFEGDEAEATEPWRSRIEGKTPPHPVMRIVAAVEREDGRERVIGGAATEY